ncbi:MAG: murein biosynthesis integral membrane protein MurJ [Aquificaceae bacterium]
MGLIRKSLSFSLAVGISRALGYLRDLAIAYHFGASYISDAFFVAFRIPNTLRRILGEGGLNAVIVPILVRRKESGNERAFASSVLFYLGLLSLILSALGAIFANVIVKTIAPGKGSEGLEIATYLTRFCFSYVFFLTVGSIAGAVLNSKGKFFVPASAQGVFNLIFALVITFGAKDLGIDALAIGVFLGGLFQALFQLFSARKEIYLNTYIDKDLKTVFKNLTPALLGFGVSQISIFVDTFMASFLKEGAISYLYYANRIFQLPLGMVSAGVATVLLSMLSEERMQKENLNLGIRLVVLISLPATFGLFLLSFEIIELLFLRGNFTSEDAYIAGKVLQIYSLGLIFFSIQKVIASLYFAKGRLKTALTVSILSVFSEAFAGFLFAFYFGMGIYGLALGNFVSSLVGFLASIAFGAYRLISLKLLYGGFIKALISSSVMSVFILLIKPEGKSLAFEVPLLAGIYFLSLLILRERVVFSGVKKLIYARDPS